MGKAKLLLCPFFPEMKSLSMRFKNQGSATALPYRW
jgi:hypothetical protein